MVGFQLGKVTHTTGLLVNHMLVNHVLVNHVMVNVDAWSPHMQEKQGMVVVMVQVTMRLYLHIKVNKCWRMVSGMTHEMCVIYAWWCRMMAHAMLDFNCRCVCWCVCWCVSSSCYF